MPRSASKADGFLDWAQKQAKAIRHNVERIAGKAKPKHVKRARVAARRLSVVIDLVEPLVKRRHLKSLANGVALIGDRLGPVRDADVLLGAASRVRASAIVRASMIEHLNRQRSQAVKKARRTLNAHAYEIDKRLARDIAKAGPALVAQLREAVHTQLDSLAEAAVRAPKESRGLHPTRIATKRLRYLLEIGVTLDVTPPNAALARLERLQDDLGEWHDATVLAAFSIEPATDKHEFEHETAAAAARLAISAHAAAHALRTAKRFHRRWTTDGPMLERALRRALPAHVAATDSNVT